jgi:hypothetical protein
VRLASLRRLVVDLNWGYQVLDVEVLGDGRLI